MEIDLKSFTEVMNHIAVNVVMYLCVMYASWERCYWL